MEKKPERKSFTKFLSDLLFEETEAIDMGPREEKPAPEVPASAVPASEVPAPEVPVPAVPLLTSSATLPRTRISPLLPAENSGTLSFVSSQKSTALFGSHKLSTGLPSSQTAQRAGVSIALMTLPESLVLWYPNKEILL